MTDHGLLVSGGVPSARRLALIDVTGQEPAVVWSVEDAGANPATDGTVIIDTADTAVTAYDVATGEQRWTVDDPAWDRAPVAGPPAIMEDVAIVARPNSTVAFGLDSSGRAWEEQDFSSYWTRTGSDLRAGDRVVGFLSTVQMTLMGADGGLAEITVDADVRGTIVGSGAEDGRVITVARGTTNRQSSTLWLVDLNDLG